MILAFKTRDRFQALSGPLKIFHTGYIRCVNFDFVPIKYEATLVGLKSTDAIVVIKSPLPSIGLIKAVFNELIIIVAALVFFVFLFISLSLINQESAGGLNITGSHVTAY